MQDKSATNLLHNVQWNFKTPNPPLRRLPVKELVLVAIGDSVTHYLVLDVPLAEAKDKLRRVRYAIPKTLSADRRVALKLFEEMAGGKADAHEVASFLKGYQAYVDSYDGNDYGEEMKGKAVLACDGGF